MPVRYNYTLTETGANQAVDVRFEPLTPDDLEILRGEEWRGARFREVWLQLAENKAGLKLVIENKPDSPLLGLVLPGTVSQYISGRWALRGSLLEACPVHQYGREQRRYIGIGRVLVARLVEESKLQNAGGRLLIVPVEQSIAFYVRLGFVPAPLRRHYQLEAEQAEALLVSYTIVSVE